MINQNKDRNYKERIHKNEYRNHKKHSKFFNKYISSSNKLCSCTKFSTYSYGLTVHTQNI